MTSIVQGIPCLICGDPLTVRTARGRKSGKPFVMLVCGRDGRHFRGFITDQTYVRELFTRVEDHPAVGGSKVELDAGEILSRHSKTSSKRGGGDG